MRQHTHLQVNIFNTYLTPSDFLTQTFHQQLFTFKTNSEYNKES